jgi:hypothetical protein
MRIAGQRQAYPQGTPVRVGVCQSGGVRLDNASNAAGAPKKTFFSGHATINCSQILLKTHSKPPITPPIPEDQIIKIPSQPCLPLHETTEKPSKPA